MLHLIGSGSLRMMLTGIQIMSLYKRKEKSDRLVMSALSVGADCRGSHAFAANRSKPAASFSRAS